MGPLIAISPEPRAPDALAFTVPETVVPPE